MVRELPTVAAGGASERPPATGGGPPDEPPAISSSRLMGTLAGAGALAGLVIVLVFGWAEPRIQAHRARVLREAVRDVLSEPARYETLYVTAAGLSATPPPGTDTVTAERVFLGYDASDEPVGYAITGSEPGFQDFIFLIFGYDPDRGRVLGMKVLESKETPGLGDKIFKDAGFVAGFEDAVAPLVGVKAGAATGDEHEVDMITGATISSRTVIGIINHRLEDLGPLLESVRHEAASGRSEGGDAGRPPPGGAAGGQALPGGGDGTGVAPGRAASEKKGDRS